MKWMIASDIHGSAYYCRQMTEAYKREHADRLLLLGDILYHGPRNDLPRDYAPKEVIAMLNPMKAELLCVRGNCDTEVDQMVLDFPILAEYCFLDVDGVTIFATHGHVYNPKNPPMLKNGDILLNGHTHIPACEKYSLEDSPVHENHLPGEESGFRYLNPGSVSIPKEGSPHSYMTMERGIFEWKTMEGQVYQTWKTDLHS